MYTEIGSQFEMSKSSVIMADMELKFKSPLYIWRQHRCLGGCIQRPNHYVDELRYRDPENSLAEADKECMQDADQEQPSIQLEMSDDHIRIFERKWKDVIANELSHRCTWESQISKVVMEQFDGN